jgi:Spy/CpxP family protein refolding chaperone
MEKPWKVILAFAGVFVAGAIFGGALWPQWFGHEGRGRRGFGELHMMDRLVSELSLTPEQKEKIAPIVARAEEETRRLRRESVQSFRAVMEKANGEIAAELTPEQKAKLDDMRKRFRERIERYRARDRDREKAPPGQK